MRLNANVRRSKDRNPSNGVHCCGLALGDESVSPLRAVCLCQVSWCAPPPGPARLAMWCSQTRDLLVTGGQDTRLRSAGSWRACRCRVPWSRRARCPVTLLTGPPRAAPGFPPTRHRSHPENGRSRGSVRTINYPLFEQSTLSQKQPALTYLRYDPMYRIHE
jgi:hypothetical protein